MQKSQRHRAKPRREIFAQIVAKAAEKRAAIAQALQSPQEVYQARLYGFQLFQKAMRANFSRKSQQIARSFTRNFHKKLEDLCETRSKPRSRSRSDIARVHRMSQGLCSAYLRGLRCFLERRATILNGKTQRHRAKLRWGTTHSVSGSHEGPR